MSRPYQHPTFNSSNPNSPLSHYPRGDTPVSFKTNVNRAKTMRWVEAKKYSYDGDDWGEDEYGEYEYDDDPSSSQAQLASANQSTGDIPGTLSRDTSQPPVPVLDRSRSMDHVATLPSQAAASNNAPTSMARPADIYRRMRDEQKTRQPPLVESPTDENTIVASLSSPPPASSSTPLAAQTAGSTHEGKLETFDDNSRSTPTAVDESPDISLPDVKRLSGFNPDIFSESGSDAQNKQDLANQPHQLQHIPSVGFRSAVHQAFDVPETPSTTTNSVARSNSDSTTAISPIMGYRGTDEDKTPTIAEEPNETVDTPTEGNIVFKPGHRRDLSLPSSGSSPSRQPVITNPDISASSVLAQISTGTPSDSPQDTTPPSQAHSSSDDPTRPSTERDMPAPLNVHTNVASGFALASQEPVQSVPVIIPSMSTDNSPQDTENDRLRKEIIRSLSRENTPSDQQTPPRTSGEDSLLPIEYESYWNEQQAAGPPDQEFLVPTSDPPLTASEPPPIVAPAPIPPQPKLQRRFSWEYSSDEEYSTPVAEMQSPPPLPIPGQYPLSAGETNQEPVIPADGHSRNSADYGGDSNESNFEKPKLTLVPPLPADAASISSGGHVEESTQSQTTEILARAEEGHTAEPPPLNPPAQIPSALIESGLLGFKDILGIQSSEDRVKAFHRTRGQFAAIDTGLSHWIRVTLQGHPEHADVVERNAKFSAGDPKPSTARTKFPKLPSLGNLASSLQDGSHSGHIRRPSAHLGSMKQQVGKDFLHTAGVLGGQAGKAAKGLFSKGKSKLKGSGGTERGFQSTRGYHRPVRLSDLQPDAGSDLDLDEQQGSTAPLGTSGTIRDDSGGLHHALWSRQRIANRDVGPFTTKDGATVFAPLSAPELDTSASGFRRQSYGQSDDDQQHHTGSPSGSINCIQGQGEDGGRNACADCKSVDDKPRPRAALLFWDLDGSEEDKQNGAFSHATAVNNKGDGAASSPRGERHVHFSASINPEVQSQDIPVQSSPPPATSSSTLFDRRRGSSQGHLVLRHLRSVSSLGMQEADLDPPPPVAQKLGQENHRHSSQVSLPSDVGDAEPRNLGRRGGGERMSPRHHHHHPASPQSPLAQREAEQTPVPLLLNDLVSLPGQPSSTARPLSTPSASSSFLQHDWSHRSDQVFSSRDPACHRSSSSPMEKLKNSRFRRISMGSSQPDLLKTGKSPKKPFHRLAGLFGRSHRKTISSPSEQAEYSSRNTTSPHLMLVSSQTDSNLLGSSISVIESRDGPISISDGRSTLQLQVPPPEGYFAHESPETFSISQPQDHTHTADIAAQDRMRLSYTAPSDPGRLSPQIPHYHSPATPQHQRHLSSPRLSSPVPSPIPQTPPSRGRSEDRTYAQELHLRSRSPKAFAPRPEERNLPNNDPTDPAVNLGTFRTNPRTSRIGDQELPWKITIPGESDDPSTADGSATWRRETAQVVINSSRLPTYQEDAQEYGRGYVTDYPQDEKRAPPLPNPPTAPTSHPNSTTQPPDPAAPQTHAHEHPHRSGARAINTFESPVELPVRADDDSSEEIMMSSTAYPGQEWRPLGFSEWDHQ